MRWLPLLLSLALPFGSFAAKKPASADKFNDFHTKSLASTPLKLADSSYRKLTASPRDYSIAVLLTAMDPRFGCRLCQEFQPEWDILAKSWVKGDKNVDSRLIFGTLDFSDGRDTFMSLGLSTAPVLLYFHPTTGPHAVPSAEGPVRYDFTSGNQQAEQVHGWLSRHLPDRPHPAVKRPINYVAWVVGVVSVLAGAGVCVKAWPYVLPVVQSRNAWAALSLIGILMFTSGHMFNQIRRVPYVAGDGKGGISYFTAGFQNQLGMETQIVAAMYGVLSFATISLIVKAPRVSDFKTQQLMILAWSGVLFLLYSFLLSIFRIKNGGYPFFLPPFA